MARSLIMPRLTTPRPRSGPLIAERTARTPSLLGTEDHRRAQRQDAHQGDARNRAPIDQVSLRTGWLVTLRSTPVYEAMKMPTTAPTTLNIRFNSGGNNCPRRSLNHASAADTKAKKPKTRSAQAPTDIGDQ